VAGATLSVSAPSPAHAQPCTSTDPVLEYACRTLGSVPDVNYLINYYYNEVGEAVYSIYCKLWDLTC
jgi:hypothetical protein